MYLKSRTASGENWHSDKDRGGHNVSGNMVWTRFVRVDHFCSLFFFQRSTIHVHTKRQKKQAKAKAKARNFLTLPEKTETLAFLPGFQRMLIQLSHRGSVADTLCNTSTLQSNKNYGRVICLVLHY